MLETAAILCFLIGIVHSSLGERFILTRLFRGDKVPYLFGSSFFTKETLRFAWHITTIVWWGFGFILWKIAAEPENLAQVILHTVSAVFFLSGGIAFGFTRGKHLSWIVFWSIAGLSSYAVLTG